MSSKSDCCGCSACSLVCPVECIKMCPDKDGFSYPIVSSKECIHCNACVTVCPILNADYLIQNNEGQVFGVKNKNELVRKNSSSGGFFSLLAEWIISQGGCVAGCELTAGMVARHKIATATSELSAFRSSKYVQSSLGTIFKEIKNKLENGTLTLFSGTPCQVAGLKAYLRKTYENLITVDVLCHGVPSPKLLKDYVQEMEIKFGGKMVYLNFREKSKGWKRLYVKATFDNGRQYYEFSGYDSYMSLFLKNKSQRSSCFSCPYNNTKRAGDISLGDFWGIGRVRPMIDDDKGISLVLVNSKKGGIVMSKLLDKVDFFESDMDTAVNGNKVLKYHLPSSKDRDAFYADYRSSGFRSAVQKHAPEPLKIVKTYYSIMRFGLDAYRKVAKKGY